ncbi:unnamed protein product [Calypogeia fissa]
MWRDLNTNISRQDIARQESLFAAGSHSEAVQREAAAAVAPAVAGGGGVTGGAGRVDSAPDWTVSSPLSDRPLKERDLSLGFGASSAHRPQEGNGLWIRNEIRNSGYGYVGAAEGSGAGIPGGLGRQQDIFREIVGARPGPDDFASSVGAQYGVGGGGVRRDEHRGGAGGADHEGGRGSASFVAYVGAGEGGRGGGGGHLGGGGPNREESGSGSTGPVSGKRKGDHDEGANTTVEGGIWGNTILREEAFKRRRLDVSMQGLEVQPLREVRPGDSRVEHNKDDQDHGALQLHDPNRAKQQQQQAPQPQPGGGPQGGVSAGTQGGTACLECGNQAKKDCLHQRCRTCCKSRGLQCPTHIKSTWVPAAKRRERQAAEAAAAAAGQPRPKSKRARSLALSAPANPTTSLTNTSAGTSPRGSDINSGQQQVKGRLPPEVRAQALFKCVQLPGVEDGENEFAYQATVKIGGHVFKGVLYDQGMDNGGSSVQHTNVADLQLGGRSMPSSSALIDPSNLYGNPGSALLGALR